MFSVIRVTNDDDPADNWLIVAEVGKLNRLPYHSYKIIRSGLSFTAAHRLTRSK